MLEGRKPLAAFVGQYPAIECDPGVPERAFAQYVQTERLIKTEFQLDSRAGSGTLVRHVLYALPEQEWRLKSYQLLLEVGLASGWSPGLERMQGRLLGYSDEECETYLRFVAGMKKSA